MYPTTIASAILAVAGLGYALPSTHSLAERECQPGWCGAHILKTVHDCDHSNPQCDSLYGFQWNVNITVFDDCQKFVGNKYTEAVPAFDVQTIGVPSKLKYDLLYSVVHGANPDIIAYAADQGDVVHPRCAVGGDGETFVSTDCGFKCEVLTD